jgi:hypothetical protein
MAGTKLGRRPGVVNISAGLRWTPDGHGLTYIDTINGISDIWLLTSEITMWSPPTGNVSLSTQRPSKEGPLPSMS